MMVFGTKSCSQANDRKTKKRRQQRVLVSGKAELERRDMEHSLGENENVTLLAILVDGFESPRWYPTRRQITSFTKKKTCDAST